MLALKIGFVLIIGTLEVIGLGYAMAVVCQHVVRRNRRAVVPAATSTIVDQHKPTEDGWNDLLMVPAGVDLATMRGPKEAQ